MKHLPVGAKILINMILYILYVLVFSLAFSILFPLVLQILGKDVLDPYNPIFVKIQIFIAVLVLLLTLIGRRYFYICLKSGDTEKKIESYTAKKGETSYKTPTEDKIREQDQDDEIRIYIDKEIK